MAKTKDTPEEQPARQVVMVNMNPFAGTQDEVDVRETADRPRLDEAKRPGGMFEEKRGGRMVTVDAEGRTDEERENADLIANGTAAERIRAMQAEIERLNAQLAAQEAQEVRDNEGPLPPGSTTPATPQVPAVPGS